MTAAEGEARRALARLRRSLLKAERELGSLRGALERAEGGELPADGYDEAQLALDGLQEWLGGEELRLRSHVLRAGGLEPGRILRS